jgi:hypothetical protein
MESRATAIRTWLVVIDAAFNASARQSIRVIQFAVVVFFVIDEFIDQPAGDIVGFVLTSVESDNIFYFESAEELKTDGFWRALKTYVLYSAD